MQNVPPQALNSTLNIAPGGRCNSLALPYLTMYKMLHHATMPEERLQNQKQTNKTPNQPKKPRGKNPYTDRHQFNC